MTIEMFNAADVLHDTSMIEKNLLVKKSDGSSLSDKLNSTSAKFLLSSRESEVLNELIDGRTNQEISENLSVSLSTEGESVYDLAGRRYASVSGRCGIHVVNGQKCMLRR